MSVCIECKLTVTLRIIFQVCRNRNPNSLTAPANPVLFACNIRWSVFQDARNICTSVCMYTYVYIENPNSFTPPANRALFACNNWAKSRLAKMHSHLLYVCTCIQFCLHATFMHQYKHLHIYTSIWHVYISITFIIQAALRRPRIQFCLHATFIHQYKCARNKYARNICTSV